MSRGRGAPSIARELLRHERGHDRVIELELDYRAGTDLELKLLNTIVAAGDQALVTRLE